MSGKPGIVYMGTPEFAVEPLKALIDKGYNVIAVVTVPDKPAGRGQIIQQSPVKIFAQSKGLEVLQPEKLKDPQFIARLTSLNPDIAVVVAFRMLPEVIWSNPRLGTFNLHASLLPQYRGAAPINWAIINGEKETGVTTFLIDKEIDTGKILLSERIEIDENDTAGDIHDKLKDLGANLVLRTVDALISGSAAPVPQDSIVEPSGLKAAPKLFRDTCKIDWTKNIREIHNLIRGLSPYPAAWTEFELSNGEIATSKIIRSGISFENHTLTPGTLVTDQKTYIKVACLDGYIDILMIQLAGKKAMPPADLLRGMQNNMLKALHLK